jgi:hypothetical protein
VQQTGPSHGPRERPAHNCKRALGLTSYRAELSSTVAPETRVAASTLGISRLHKGAVPNVPAHSGAAPAGITRPRQPPRPKMTHPSGRRATQSNHETLGGEKKLGGGFNRADHGDGPPVMAARVVWRAYGLSL